MAVTVVNMPDKSIFKSQNDWGLINQVGFQITDTTVAYQDLITGTTDTYIQLLKLVISVSVDDCYVRFRCNGNVFLIFYVIVGFPIVLDLNHIPITCEIGQTLEVVKTVSTSQLFIHAQYIKSEAR